MPVGTNLEVNPYYDDFSELKDFYRILFKPGVPVQTRELNQLQSIFQNQIERFGDNIFQKGTIIDGCHITFHNVFPYIKIRDATTVGVAINVEDFEGFYLKNSANLQAYVVTSTPGFESQSPNLNTLYVKYLNSGDTNDVTSYSANQVLTVFKPDNRIFQININNGSTGFSNSDSVVISSALAVQNSVGGTTFSTPFTLNEYITNGNGANVQVVSIDSTTNSQVLILGIKPQPSQLITSNTILWTIAANDAVTGLTSGATATVVDLVGGGASASVRTNSIGKITNVNIVAEGSGYYVNPVVTVRSTTANTLQISTANLTPQNFLCQITIAPSLTVPVGTGYAVTVSDGVIFQKGYFQRVEEQLLVVEAYANTPDLKVVGFDSTEELINSNIDQSLLDNALGTQNYTAPGADRLKLTPTLITLSKAEADANTDFFTVVEFSQGAPFKHNKQTSYNIIEQEMARRTAEESGNYVVDTFSVNTKSITPFANEASQFITSVDPGLAYIDGFRVETVENFNGATAKGVDTVINTAANISLNYGSYIKVKELAGMFDFGIGSVVNLYDTAKGALTNLTTISPAGNQIGSARVRSLMLESGTPGSPNATYRMYLFNIVMNTGKTFGSVRSIYQTVTPNGGIADAVLTDGNAFLFDSNLSSLLFQSGVDALKNANSINYTYRMVDTALTVATTGLITKTLGAGESWPISGNWATPDKLSLLVVPQANVTATANIAGSVTTSTSSPTVTGTSTSFNTVFSPGDYIRFANSTANGYGRIASVVNSTSLTLAANASIAITGANAQVYFPQGIAVNLTPSTRTVNVSSQTITINLGQPTNAANVTLVHNVYAANVQPVAKTTTRNVYVRLALSNNATTYTGPWCLGHADVFRLRGVWKGSNNTFAETDPGITDVTNNFYIDHNQTESFYDTSFLFKKSRSTLSLSGSDTLLVKMDIFRTSSEGMKTVKSYSIDDTQTLANLTTAVNTVELPEVFGRTDTYYDIRDCIDFRPVSANTANVATTLINATINPPEPAYATAITSSAKKFPVPGSTLSATFEYYVGRTDRVVVTDQGDISILPGEPAKGMPPTAPPDALTINLLKIPPFPSLPFSMSTEMVKLADTKIANEKYTNLRLSKYRISTPSDSNNNQTSQPRGYTMQDIGKLEARIADMEYYISYLLSEIDTIGKIPGNLDGSTNINRYKYGYFVDDYNDPSRSDINNPEFYSSFDAGRLVPRLVEFNLQFKSSGTDGSTGEVFGIGYIEYPLISQLVATDGPVKTTPPVSSNTSSNTTPTPNTTPANTTVVVQSTANVTVFNKNTLSSSSWTVYEDSEFFMSSTAGAVQMYFNSREDDIAIEIFQSSISGSYSNTPILTAQNAVTYTTADLAKMQGLLNNFVPLNAQGFQGSPSKFVVDSAGKILWTHNPSNGRYYRIRIWKQNKAGDNHTFAYRLYYPVDSVVTISNTATIPATFVHTGMITSVVPQTFQIKSTLTYESNGTVANAYFTDSQKFVISCSGLKPSTNHKFYMDTADKSASCQQSGKALGATLVSGTDGTLTFNFFYDAGLTEVTSDFERYNTMAAQIAGYKAISVQSSDGASMANGQIHITSTAGSSLPSTSTTLSDSGAGSLIYSAGLGGTVNIK